MTQKIAIGDLRHPYYRSRILEWEKWRFTWEGGQQYINRYLQPFSKRETGPDFERRRLISYNPAFGKEAVNEIKNSIFQKMVSVTRKGGSKTYNDACSGISGGIDLLGSSINTFIGTYVLPELLTMARIGIFVDMPKLSGITIQDNRKVRPYLYFYRTEDVLSWSYSEMEGETEFTSILLKENIFLYDDETGLPDGEVERFRRMWLKDGKVNVKFYDNKSQPIHQDDSLDGETIVLDLPKIPFILVEIGESLLTEVANYQIALLNMASADLAYTLQANFPFYTEQYDPRASSENLRKSGSQGGEATDGSAGKTEEVRVGVAAGRRYPKGTDRPGFINPSSEPLIASMKKQDQLKQEIRELVHLAVSNLAPNVKNTETGAFEAGLAYIGGRLEMAERRIANYWAMYEQSSTPATIKYPDEYSVQTKEAKIKEATDLSSLMEVVPSLTYKKEMAKRISEVTLDNNTSIPLMTKIYNEIDSAKAMISDVVSIAQDVEIGLVSLDTASKLRGYPDGEVEKAAKDHADRLARIQTSQSSDAAPNGGIKNPQARGVIIADPNLNSGQIEKKKALDKTQDPVVTDKIRGEGK